MSGPKAWKEQSPRKIGLALFIVFGFFMVGAWQLLGAFTNGEVDWPGRGHSHFKRADHPGWFFGAVIGWFIMEAALAYVLARGSQRLLWLIRHRDQRDS